MAATTIISEAAKPSNYSIDEVNVTESSHDLLGRPGVDQSVDSVISSSIQISLAYILIGCIGMIGNLFVVIVMVSSKQLRRKIPNIYITNQSAIDFSVSFFLAVSAKVNSTVPYGGLAGDLYCKWWQSKMPLWGILVSSTYNLLALTVERYLEVVHPIWHKISFSAKKAYISLPFIWLFGPIFNIIHMTPTCVVVNGQCSLFSKWPSEGWRTVYGVSLVFVHYFIPLAVLIICYGGIALALHRRVRVEDTSSTNGQNLPARDEKWKRGRRNTVITLALVGMSFIACWSINQIYYFMFNVGYPPEFTSDFYHATVILVFLNVCINPFIYALKYEQFQITARSLLFPCLVKPNTVGILDETEVTGLSSQRK